MDNRYVYQRKGVLTETAIEEQYITNIENNLTNCGLK
jgi:hypothetical protein